MRFALLLRIVLVVALGCGVAPALAEGPPSVARLAARLAPAVVNISSSLRLPNGNGEPYPKAPDGSPLNDLLEQVNPNSGEGGDALEEARSLGSGFVIDPDGLIVTNFHVIDGAEEILVFTADGTRLTARVVGSDDSTDLAVLKVDAGHPLAAVGFGDSDKAQVGDWVMAIGNPFGLGGSVSIGIVSARNRDFEVGPFDDFIQTDAAINEGNSGGPLFDMDGNVVGINTALISAGGSSTGIGFAIAGNLAKPVVEQLAQFGETRRGWLGIDAQDLTDDLAKQLGRSDTSGAYVVDVDETGPAQGVLQSGDLIVGFNGRRVARMRDLARYVAEAPVGGDVALDVLRAGKEEKLSLKLGRLEGNAAAPVESSLDPDTGESLAPPPGLPDLIGLDLAPVDDALRQSFNLASSVHGLLVTAVSPGSAAAEAGIAPGARIAGVNQQKCETVADVIALVGEAKEAGRPSVLFKVTDAKGSSRFVPVKLK